MRRRNQSTAISLTQRSYPPILFVQPRSQGLFPLFDGVERRSAGDEVDYLSLFRHMGYMWQEFAFMTITFFQTKKLRILLFIFLGPIFVAVWIFLSIFSALIQFTVTSKNIEKGGDICLFSSATVCKCLFPCCYQCCKLTDLEEKSKINKWT